MSNYRQGNVLKEKAQRRVGNTDFFIFFFNHYKELNFEESLAWIFQSMVITLFQAFTGHSEWRHCYIIFTSLQELQK